MKAKKEQKNSFFSDLLLNLCIAILIILLISYVGHLKQQHDYYNSCRTVKERYNFFTDGVLKEPCHSNVSMYNWHLSNSTGSYILTTDSNGNLLGEIIKINDYRSEKELNEHDFWLDNNEEKGSVK